MSGNGSTGERISLNYNASLWTEDAILELFNTLAADFRLYAPVGNGNRTVFREVATAGDMNLEGGRTMTPPGKTFFFRPRQDLLRFDLQAPPTVEMYPAASEPALLVGIRPCDMHALLYLDRTLGTDPYYQAVRQNTILLAVNCSRPTQYCFCSSVETGPFFKAAAGCDAVLTNLQQGWLVEPLHDNAARLFSLGGPVTDRHWREKADQEKAARDGFAKHIDFQGLEPALLRNSDHAVWARTADERCLSCSNCVMVCPTCFCHDIRDSVAMDLERVVRYRQWDACQDLGFAAIHGGNFRRTRKARLRQFVLHKLDFTSQYGQAGTVGCGRCIEWCPTAIDLTEIAREIRSLPNGESVPSP
jgi:sulfhydrogenase subunit beta (sulfur reductase)